MSFILTCQEPQGNGLKAEDELVECCGFVVGFIGCSIRGSSKAAFLVKATGPRLEE